MDVMTGAAPQLETILWTARNAGTSLIISRGQDPAAIRHMLDHGLVRERLGHLVLTFKGMELRRSCAPH